MASLPRRPLRESEARTHAVLATTVDAVVVIDERGVVETFNQAVERMFGYATEEEIGENVCVLMPEAYRREHVSYLAYYLQTGQKKIISIGRGSSAGARTGQSSPWTWR